MLSKPSWLSRSTTGNLIEPDFKTIADVQKRYQIKYTQANFIVSEELSPPESFLKDFEFSKENIDIF